MATYIDYSKAHDAGYENMKCTKPDCNCLEIAEEKARGGVKEYPCLFNRGKTQKDLVKQLVSKLDSEYGKQADIRQEEVTPESIVERILFGKGGSKQDYANDIKQLVSGCCKKQRNICVDEWNDWGQDKFSELFEDQVERSIKNAPEPKI